MARLFTLATTNDPHRIMDIENRACPECVPDCDDVACVGDDRCTEQCIIVACDDPEHGDTPCSEDICESACVDPKHCFLPVHQPITCETHQNTSCAQDGCGLFCGSTCDDPENCSLAAVPAALCYHSTADQAYSPRSQSADFNASMEAFLCSCRGESPLRDGLLPTKNPSDPYAGPSPSLSAITSLSDSNTLSSTFSTPFQPTAYIPPLYIQHSPTTIAHEEHTCLWNGCRSSFSSLAELVSHVNLSHLNVYLSEPPDPFATSSSCLRFSSEMLGLSCQWDNCHEYSSTPVAPSGGLGFGNALNSLTGHLLHDHLGLQGTPGSHNAVPTDNPIIADAISPIQEPEPNRDVEMRDQEQISVTQTDKQQSKGSDGSVKQHGAAKGHRADEHSLPADKTPSPTLDGPERCCWDGCGLSFASVDDLMNHLTVDHVGSGKNHYECFWSGCKRSGEKGFSSKQKVCRHLQMHTGHKPFQCKLCKQHFSEAATLQQHMRRHTQEKPYLCDVPGCGKAFAIAGALTIHRRTHMGLKPFKCKYCERAFSESSNLSKHMRTHTGVRPYVCEEPGCGKAFARPDQFTRHQGVHSRRHRTIGPVHENEMYPPSHQRPSNAVTV
ncbi:hypothetical protein EDB87DRAFT_1721045 [Lactarius vividus]|nr:hypothetical protein EDB87DRAFT_1721045 [Lactarius vividus]